MPNQKTATELQLEADAAKRAEAQAKLDDDARLRDMLESAKGIGFSNILLIGFAILGLYLFGKSEMGQNLFHGIVDNFSPETQVMVLGFMNKMGLDIDMSASLEAMDRPKRDELLAKEASPEVVSIIDPDNKTFHEFLTVVRNANDGKVTPKSFTSPATLAALIKEKPEMAKALMGTAKPDAAKSDATPSAPNTPGTPAPIPQPFAAPLKAFVKSPQFDTLLSEPTEREKTLKLLATLLPPDMPLRQDALNIIVNQGLDADRKPKDNLRKLLSDAVDGKTAVLAADVAAIVGTSNMVMLADPAKITDPVAKYFVTTMQQNPKAKAAQDALIEALGPKQAGPFIDALQSQQQAGDLAQLMLTKENVHALPQAAALLDQLPDLASKLAPEQGPMLTQVRTLLTQDHTQAIINIVNNGVDPIALSSHFMADDKLPLESAVDALLDPTVRADLKKAGTDNIEVLVGNINTLLNKRNLDAIIRFGDKIDDGKAPTENTQRVMHALAQIVSGTPMKDAFNNLHLDGGKIAAVFSVPANREAIEILLDKDKGITTTNPQMRAELDLLRKDFIVTPQVGLASILSDATSVDFLLQNADKAAPATGNYIVDTANHAKAVAAMMAEGGAALSTGWSNGNRDIIFEISQVLGGTGTTSSAAATPTAPVTPTASASAARPQLAPGG